MNKSSVFTLDFLTNESFVLAFVKDNLMQLKLGVMPKDSQIVTMVGLTEKSGLRR